MTRQMPPPESPWTPEDDDFLRSALLTLRDDATVPLPEPAFVRAHGARVLARRRWMRGVGAVASVAALATAGAFAIGYAAHNRGSSAPLPGAGGSGQVSATGWTTVPGQSTPTSMATAPTSLPSGTSSSGNVPSSGNAPPSLLPDRATWEAAFGPSTGTKPAGLDIVTQTQHDTVGGMCSLTGGTLAADEVVAVDRTKVDETALAYQQRFVFTSPGEARAAVETMWGRVMKCGGPTTIEAVNPSEGVPLGFTPDAPMLWRYTLSGVSGTGWIGLVTGNTGVTLVEIVPDGRAGYAAGGFGPVTAARAEALMASARHTLLTSETGIASASTTPTTG